MTSGEELEQVRREESARVASLNGVIWEDLSEEVIFRKCLEAARGGVTSFWEKSRQRP